MKKLIITILTIVLAMCAFTGCTNSKPLTGVEGTPYNNGSFLVEKGDYVYFINGKEAVTASNKSGKVEKGSLLRVKKEDLGKKDASVETVISKLLISANYTTGFYMYGNCVYYVTPSTEKDKAGNVLNTHNEFYCYDMTKGKNVGGMILRLENNNYEYRFIEVDGVVYLATTVSSVDENSVTLTKLVVYNTSTGDCIFTSNNYSSLIMPEDNSNVIFYTQKGITKALDDAEQDFEELYRYEVGNTEATLELSGAGYADLSFDDRANTLNGKLVEECGTNGVTFTLIKHTGKILVYKTNKLDADNNGSYFYGATSSDNFTAKTKLGASNEYIALAMAKTSHFESLNEVYYVESGDGFITALMRFDYTKQNDVNMLNGRTIVCEDVENMSISFVKDGYIYLTNASEGIYYRCALTATDATPDKINAIPMQTATDWFVPTVIGNYFIGSYSANYYANYVYTIDISKLGTEDYEEYLEKYEEENRENILELQGTLLGKYSTEEATTLQELLDSNYPEETEDEE